MNPFGNNPFNGGMPSVQYSGPFPAQNLGQFGNAGGFYSGNLPFQGGNMFPGAGGFAPSGFPPGSMGGGVGPNFGLAPFPNNGFGMQPSPFAPSFLPEQQFPYAPAGPQAQFGDPNYFGSGSYGRPRSRHRSSSRRRRRSGSSSGEEEPYRAGSPYGAAGPPYINLQPLPNGPILPPRLGSPLMLPRGGSPVMFPRAGSPLMMQQQPGW